MGGVCVTSCTLLFYLHATQSDSQRRRRALFAFLHLPGRLLLRGVVSVLPGAHLQVQDAGVGEVVNNVLQQQELWLKQPLRTIQRKHLAIHARPSSNRDDVNTFYLKSPQRRRE